MYLSRLEMVGFKSFAHKIDLSFNDGVTAIVGPNGCGKTNIVDAIRWVLGEQKTSMLRADSMDQVIFNGSKARKPLGMAEVSLTIENNKKILPTEYAQVVITRRLFRSGESQYLLNKTQCRLRDIVDLFMDTGMGANAYSVIELKMIETILSDKADERRHLFEEAAGVTKYKARRKEASRKLEAAQRDIARVQDIVREIEKTVSSLARQATKARRHQETSSELKDIERVLFAFEYAEEWAALKQFEDQVRTIREQKQDAEKAVEAAELGVAMSEASHESAERIHRQKQDEETAVRSALSDAKQQASVLDERLNSANRTIERLEKEHSESSEQQLTTAEQLRNVRDRLTTVKQELVAASEVVDQRKMVVDGSLTEVNNLRNDLHSQRATVASVRQQATERRSTADRLRVQGEAVVRRLSDNAMQQDRLKQRLVEVDGQVSTESSAMPALDESLAAAETALHNAEERQASLRAEQETIQVSLDSLRSKAAHSSASLEFLTGLVDTAESSKFLMSTSEWSPSGEKLTLAEVMNTSDDLRVAIEAALGESARYFVVATRAEADQAISALSRNKVGKATFLCRDAIPNIQAPPPLQTSDSVLGWASELVEIDDTLRGAVRGILGRTIVVESVDAAWNAIASTEADAAVTTAGEIVHRSGAVRGGSRSRTEGVRVGRKERIKQLGKEIAALKEQIQKADSRIDEIKSELGNIDVRSLASTVRQVALARNERQQKVDSLKGRLEDLNGQLANLVEEAAGFTEEGSTISTQLVEVDAAVENLQSDLTSKEHDVADQEAKLRGAEETHSNNTDSLREAEIMMVRLDGDAQNLEADERRLTNESLNIDQRRDQRERERDGLGSQKEQLFADMETARERVSSEQQRLTEASAVREHQELIVRECSAATHAALENVRTVRRQLEGITNELHKVDLKHNNSTIRMEALVHRATEDLEIEVPESPATPEHELSITDLRSQTQELRRKLTLMGNVNFLALEEHERENERFEFLTKQLADLVASEKTLTETIAEINRTAREHFVTTFEAIRKNFTGLFKVLFSDDDEADLEMIESDDHDPLECKIEIIAKPRGKRPHSIEMLSGGEKTLTAIALLFAIYLVKPSPFCILDEVDAPLDDANIDRYLKLIRKFSENTQFLMITHNKKTMEAADTLYGVTMEETAVSKVVSVHLSAEQQNNTAA